jgi:hypothetical protein
MTLTGPKEATFPHPMSCQLRHVLLYPIDMRTAPFNHPWRVLLEPMNSGIEYGYDICIYAA